MGEDAARHVGVLAGHSILAALQLGALGVLVYRVKRGLIVTVVRSLSVQALSERVFSGGPQSFLIHVFVHYEASFDVHFEFLQVVDGFLLSNDLSNLQFFISEMWILVVRKEALKHKLPSCLLLLQLLSLRCLVLLPRSDAGEEVDLLVWRGLQHVR